MPAIIMVTNVISTVVSITAAINEVTVEAEVEAAADPEVTALLLLPRIEKGLIVLLGIGTGIRTGTGTGIESTTILMLLPLSTATAGVDRTVHKGTDITVIVTVTEIDTLTPPIEDPGMEDPIDPSVEAVLAVVADLLAPEDESIAMHMLLLLIIMVMVRVVIDPKVIKRITITMNTITKIIEGKIEARYSCIHNHNHSQTSIIPDPPSNTGNNILPCLIVMNPFFRNIFMKRNWIRKHKEMTMETETESVVLMILLFMTMLVMRLIQPMIHPPTKQLTWTRLSLLPLQIQN